MKKLFFVFLSVFVFESATIAQYDLTVAQDGTGNYTTIQAAINAAPSGRTTAYKIFIKKGKYFEKISLPSNKPFIYLIGEDVGSVVLSWNDYSGKPMPGGGTYGTSNSASVTFNASDCGAINITFENTTGDAPQALAINVNATRCAFKNCRFLGGQDTILTNGNGNLQYFKNCYVDGVVDFIFGAAIAVFDSCVVYPKTRQDGLSGSYLTAANTPVGQSYGYVFRDCVIPANRGTTSYVMGRPWQNDGTTSPTSNTKVVFINTTMSSSIKPQGWDVWNSSTNTSLITYAEYRSRKFDSSLVDITQRVSWSQQLTAAQAVTYSNANIFGTWDPCSALSEMCLNTSKPLAISNFKGVKGGVNSTLTWNICWPLAAVKYEIFKSTNRVSFSKVADQISINDSSVNFTYTEAIPPPGSTYYYYILSSKLGFQNHISDTIEISSTPTITASGSMGSFLQGLGTPSAAQTYSFSGVNLTSNVSITAPSGYEISSNAGVSWNNNTAPLIFTPDINGNLAVTTISVRLNANVVGAFNDTIRHTSTGAVEAKIYVNGVVQSAPVVALTTLIQWPLIANNIDDANVRNSAIVASVPAFSKFYTSNGTTVAAVPAYSTTYGQAFSATANGDGSWATASGGPGGNLNRLFYEQFTVKAANGSSVRIDSFILSTSFYGTSSNTKVAIVYSKSGFTNNDSTNINGGIGADGLSMLPTANGGFTTPVVLANETSGTINTYRFSLTGSSGVSLAANETLTFRVYYSCGSTSTGRYAKIKNVIIKGLTNASLSSSEVTNFFAVNQNNQVTLSWDCINNQTITSFNIEKSFNGINFQTIATVSAKNVNTYKFIDASFVQKTTYYRLKILDKDLSTKYTNIITLKNTTKNVILYPNPSENSIQILYDRLNDDAIIQIGSYKNQTLLYNLANKGTTHSEVDISSLPSGFYFLRIYNNTINQTIPFIKK